MFSLFIYISTNAGLYSQSQQYATTRKEPPLWGGCIILLQHVWQDLQEQTCGTATLANEKTLYGEGQKTQFAEFVSEPSRRRDLSTRTAYPPCGTE